jgi:P27 family predicted phage terminase small subunit
MSARRTGLPEPPASFSEAERLLWRDVVAALRDAHALGRENVLAIERYCRTASLWRTAAQHVADEGAITTAAKTKVAMVNPWLSIERKAAAELARLERELGLAPTRRRTLAAPEPLGLTKEERAAREVWNGQVSEWP